MVEKNIEAKYACLTAEEWIAFGATNDSKEVTAYQANGAIWHSYARIGNKNSLTISATSTGYLALPKLSDNLSKVRIHVASNQKSLSKVFFANTVGTASTNQYVETDKGGIYEIDLSSVNKTTGYIRCSKASINLSKIEVFTQNDTRPALATPRDVQAHLRINTQNSLSVFGCCRILRNHYARIRHTHHPVCQRQAFCRLHGPALRNHLHPFGNRRARRPVHHRRIGPRNRRGDIYLGRP